MNKVLAKLDQEAEAIIEAQEAKKKNQANYIGALAALDMISDFVSEGKSYAEAWAACQKAFTEWAAEERL